MQIISNDGLTNTVQILDKSGNDLVKNLDIKSLTIDFPFDQKIIATMQVMVHKLDLQNIESKEVKHEI